MGVLEELDALDALEKKRKNRKGIPAVEPLVSEEAQAGFFASLKQTPGALMEMLGTLPSSIGLGGQAARANLLAQQAKDIVAAREGNQEASARVGGREFATGAVGSVFPVGRGLGAVEGGLSAGAEALAAGRNPLPAAAGGAVLGAILPGAGRQAGKLLGKVRGTDKAVSRVIAGANQVSEPVQNVIEALRMAKPLERAQRRSFRLQRGAKARAFKEAGAGVSGEAGAAIQQSRLRGELRRIDPKDTFTAIRQRLSQRDIDALFDQVKTHPTLREFERARVNTSLWKILGKEGGELPTKGEIKMLDSVFGPEFTEAVLSNRRLSRRVLDATINVANIPRSIMSSMDLSAPLRQGAFLVGRPRQFLPAFAKMFRAFGSEKAFKALNDDLAGRANAGLYRDANLSLTDMGTLLSGREEAFMSQWAEKLPTIGRGVRASSRAYSGFLNKLRADTFDDIVKNARRSGVEIDDKFLKDLGEFINNATGRGKLPGRLPIVNERNAAELSAALFSPRLIASRVNIMKTALVELPGIGNVAGRLGYERMDPFVRKEFYKTAMSAASMGLSVLSLAAMAGANVEADPRSSDFGKIRFGNTRYDLFAGFQQYVRLGAQMVSGHTKSAATGEVKKLGEGFKPKTRLSVAATFARNKMAPIPAMVFNMLDQKNSIGQPITPSVAAQQAVTPLILQDAREAIDEWGLETGLAVAAPAVFGVGVNTFEGPSSRPDSSGVLQALEDL